MMSITALHPSTAKLPEEPSQVTTLDLALDPLACIGKSRFSRGDLATLAKFTEVEHLVLDRRTNLLDSDLIFLASAMPQLKSLSLKDCKQLTPAAFLHLFKLCPGLLKLNVSGVRLFDDTCLEALNNSAIRLRLFKGDHTKITLELTSHTWSCALEAVSLRGVDYSRSTINHLTAAAARLAWIRVTPSTSDQLYDLFRNLTGNETFWLEPTQTLQAPTWLRQLPSLIVPREFLHFFRFSAPQKENTPPRNQREKPSPQKGESPEPMHCSPERTDVPTRPLHG